MSREDYESAADDESESAGRFARADATVMASRKIIRAKRPSSEEDAGKATAPSASLNPFAGINFTQSAASSSAGSTAPAEKKTEASVPQVKSGTSKADGEEAKKKLRRLNRAFLTWLDRQTQVNPLAIWKAGVTDYIKYASTLRDTISQEEEAENEPVPPVKATPSSTKTGDSAAGSVPSFASIQAPAKPAEGVNPFMQPSSSTLVPSLPQFPTFDKTKPSFSFPSFTSVAPTTQSGSAFSFPPLPKGPLSSFSATNPVSKEDEEEGEEEPILEPEKVGRNPEDRDEILHEVPCKLFRFAKETNEWKDGGKGSFRVTRDPETKKTRMLIRNTLGKVSLNSSFFKGMSFQQAGNSAIRFAAVAGDEGKLQSLMLKLKPTDVANTLAILSEQVSALT